MSLGFTKESTALYGVLVSEESYLIAQRALVKRDYVHMVVNKALSSPKLPKLAQELKDLVADELFELEIAVVKRRWKDYATPIENATKFQYSSGHETQFERNAISSMRTMGVTATRVWTSTPGRKDDEQFFIHLTAAPVLPTLSLGNTAPYVAGAPNTIKYPGSLGETTVGLFRPTSQPHLQSDFATFVPNPRQHPYFRGKDVEEPNPQQVARLLVLDVNHAIANWNATLLDCYIDTHALQVVPCTAGNSRAPVLTMWEHIYYD